MGLNAAPRGTDEADAIFARLTALFDGTPEAEAPALLARLVIVLAQHVGDEAVIEEAVRIAREPPTSRATSSRAASAP